MERHQRIDRLRVDPALVGRMGIDPFAHALVAEILDQHPAISGVLTQYAGRAQAVPVEPVRHVQERLRVLVRRRRMHQHGAVTPHPYPEVAAEAGIADERGDFRAFPPGATQKLVNLVERRIAHGQRLCQDVPGVTTASRPSPTFSSAMARQFGSWAKPPA